MRNVYNDNYSEQRKFEQKESTAGAILRMMKGKLPAGIILMAA
jgi:hypothetical protein